MYLRNGQIEAREQNLTKRICSCIMSETKRNDLKKELFYEDNCQNSGF